MPIKFIIDMPPFKPKLSKKTIARVIEIREIEKASFVKISKKLCITQAKAKRTYEVFYHEQVLELVNALYKKAENIEEKNAIIKYYFKGNKSSKKHFEMLTNGSINNNITGGT